MTARFNNDLFKFLNDLAAHNEREWFKANKDRYEQAVKDPALEFIEAFGERLPAFAPRFEANAKAVGGSMFRIHRDTRFSKDKTPYKLNTGLHFRHESAKDAYAPGYYLHLQPRQCFVGVGLWRPETRVAYEIRDYMVAHPDDWKKATRRGAFAKQYELVGDSLSRPPRGFDPDHALIEDLKRKDFIATARLTQKEVTSPDFIKQFEKHCRSAEGFMQFLCEAVGVKF